MAWKKYAYTMNNLQKAILLAKYDFVLYVTLNSDIIFVYYFIGLFVFVKA